GGVESPAVFLNSIEKELPIATLAPNHAVAPAPITLSVNRPSGTITISEPHTNGTKSESVAELFDRSGSAKPLGGATVAVFTSGVVTLALTVPVSVYVTLPPTGRFTVSLMSGPPLAVHVPPPAPTHVHVAPVMPAG